MSRKWKEFSGIALLKWAALFAVAFVLSLPVTAETGFAANNYTVTVASGYLALRNAKAYDSSNEIGELYTGDTVDVTDSSGSTYWTVYSPKHGKTGYVNRAYLANSAGSRTVKVDSGYLALRNDKAYDSKMRWASCIPEIPYRSPTQMMTLTGWYMLPDLARADM